MLLVSIYFSVPCDRGYFFTMSPQEKYMTTENMTVSVPCDRGYFFTNTGIVKKREELKMEFPSPAIGDIFLPQENKR